MKKRIVMILAILILFTIFFCGCNETVQNESVVTVFNSKSPEKSSNENSAIRLDAFDGDIEIIFISSGKEYYNQKDREVRAKLSEIMESDKKIVAIKTVYVEAYLVAVEIYCSK